jgi:hypothetical protein
LLSILLVSGEAGVAITTPCILTAAETINGILVQEKGEERQEQDPDTDLDMDSFLSDLERNSARTSGTFRFEDLKNPISTFCICAQ